MKIIKTLSLVIYLLFTFSCNNAVIIHSLKGTYYSIDEKKTKKDYHPLKCRITFFDADSFNYYFSWGLFLDVSKGKYYIVRDKIILNTPNMPGLLSSKEEIIESDSLLFIFKTEDDLPLPWIIKTNINSNKFIADENGMAILKKMPLDSLFLYFIGEKTISYKVKNSLANKFTFTIRMSEQGTIYFKNEKWSILSNKKIISPEGVIFKSN